MEINDCNIGDLVRVKNDVKRIGVITCIHFPTNRGDANAVDINWGIHTNVWYYCKDLDRIGNVIERIKELETDNDELRQEMVSDF
jgi:hypothetical protein